MTVYPLSLSFGYPLIENSILVNRTLEAFFIFQVVAALADNSGLKVKLSAENDEQLDGVISKGNYLFKTMNVQEYSGYFVNFRAFI